MASRREHRDSVELRFAVDADVARLLLTVYAVIVDNRDIYPSQILSEFVYLLELLAEYLDFGDRLAALDESAKRNYELLFPKMTPGDNAD